MELPVILPLAALSAGVLLQLLLGRVLSPSAKGWLAVFAGLIALVGSFALVPAIGRGTAIRGQFFLWDAGVPFAYHVDGLSLLFLLMATGIGTAILLYSIRYMAHEAAGITRFYALMLLFMAGLVNLVCAADLMIAYLSWEVIGLCSYFLVGFWYREQAAADGARKVLVMTHLPGYGLLAALLILHGRTGSFLWADPGVASAFTGPVFVLMLTAAMAKSVLFPLHTWIPEAMHAPTPVSALLHSACYVKAGVYLVARMHGLAPWPEGWSALVLTLGCLTMLVGALLAMIQSDLKRLLAYSTVSQLGHIITGLGLGTSLGVAAGLFYCVAHGLFKATLFLCAGAVEHATGTRDLRRLGGLAGPMAGTARIWLVAAGAIVGIPLCNGFVAKWLLYDAALERGQIVVVMVAWLASVFTAFYMLKATIAVFYGELPSWLQRHPVVEAAPTMRFGMGLLGGLCLLFGVAPQILMAWVVMPAVRSLGFAPDLPVSWLGVRATVSGAGMTVGPAIVLLALAGGVLVFRLASGSRSKTAGVFTGGDPLPAETSVTAADFADMAETAFAPICRATDPDPMYLAVWRGIKEAAGWCDGILTPLGERHPVLVTVVVAALVLALAWVL
ncbi:MAG TPA: NADH-quinone oxidoreductase subunit L [Candidatus Methylomirabilis sp.]|nr:NADH-quinone oxidoreductase subunit L [Candidatus Methylomirabilis sp.]